MKSDMVNLRLYNGVEIPRIGLGTWQSRGTEAAAAVSTGLQAGYRLIDTAAAYGNEAGVGEGIRQSGVPRQDVFLTSKLRNASHGYQATLDAFEASIQKLGVTYLDLYLIHWPNPIQYRTTWREAMIGTWKAFEKLYQDGRIRAIGVSNFLPHHMEILRQECEIVPMVNQLRLCPGITQPEVVDYCIQHNIVVEAYSPFGTGMIFKVPQMQVIARKYQKSVGQVVLRWCLQMGWVPLPKSANPNRIRENLDVFDFELDELDLQKIANLKDVCGTAPVPDEIRF